jgi:hypothetical protein
MEWASCCHLFQRTQADEMDGKNINRTYGIPRPSDVTIHLAIFAGWSKRDDTPSLSQMLFSKWNMSRVNYESIYDPCTVIIQSSAHKCAMSRHSSIQAPVCHESLTRSNGEIGTEVRHPLSVEQGVGSQAYPN